MEMTYAEYLATEEASEVRREFYEGTVRPIPDATLEHSALSVAVATVLFNQIRGRCNAFNTALRIRTGSGLTTYPDVTIVCGKTERDAIDQDALTNPTLIVEILGHNTEAYDRGEKFEHYKTIRALQQYMLVSQDERVVEVWTRGEDSRWTSSIYRDGDTAALSSIHAQLDVHETYEINGSIARIPP